MANKRLTIRTTLEGETSPAGGMTAIVPEDKVSDVADELDDAIEEIAAKYGGTVERVTQE